MDMLQLFDLTGLVTTEVASRYNGAGIKWFYWQIGYEEPIEDYHSFPDGVPVYDIVFLANKYSSDRLNLVDSIITKFGAKNVGLYGNGWPNGWAKGSTLYDFNSGDALYKRCKIAISDSQWPRATGFVSNRLLQAMSSGAFLLQQRFDGMEELLGLKDGIHLVVWDTFEDFADKVVYYMNHESDRKRIAEVGCQFVRDYHSFDVRICELWDELYE
jgi:spore maturation protein CgeB